MSIVQYIVFKKYQAYLEQNQNNAIGLLKFLWS